MKTKELILKRLRWSYNGGINCTHWQLVRADIRLPSQKFGKYSTTNGTMTSGVYGVINSTGRQLAFFVQSD